MRKAFMESCKGSTVVCLVPSRTDNLTNAYYDMVKARGLAKKTEWKYRADIGKLKIFCDEKKLSLAHRFGREVFFKYRSWLAEQGYADKTVYGALILAKQVFKWGYQEGKLREYKLANAKAAKAKAKPQPCFTTDEVELILANTEGVELTALATLAYEGLRVAELEQLQWIDVKLGRGDLGMLHICRGGSTEGQTKTKRDRFVPIHPRVKPLLEALPRISNEPLVFPEVTERKLLKRLKQICQEIGLVNPNSYKLHSFRHHFASMCANHQVAYKKALSWLGHRSSDILDLYYHLNDAESQSAMASLADDTFPTLAEGVQEATKSVEDILRTLGESKIEKRSEPLSEQEFLSVLDFQAERAGFEPAVRVIPVRRFSKPLPSATRPPLQRCLIS